MNRLSESMNFTISDEIIKVNEYERKPLNLIEKYNKIEIKRSSIENEQNVAGSQLEEKKEEPLSPENEQDLEEVNEILEERGMKLQQIEMLEARNESAFNKLMDVRKNMNKKQTIDEDFYNNDDFDSSFESQRKNQKGNMPSKKSLIIAEERKNEYKNRKKNAFTEPDPEIFDIQQLETTLIQKEEEIARLVELTSKSENSENDTNVKLALFQRDYEILRQENESFNKKIIQLNFTEAKSNFNFNELKKNINELRNEIGKFEILLEEKEDEIFTLKNQDNLQKNGLEAFQREISNLEERMQENEEIFQAELLLKNEKIEQYLLEIEEGVVQNESLKLLVKENKEQLRILQNDISKNAKVTRDIELETNHHPNPNLIDRQTQSTFPCDHKSTQVELDLNQTRNNNSEIYSIISNVLASTPQTKKEISLDIFNDHDNSIPSTPKYKKKINELANLVRPQKESIPQLRNLRTNIFSTKQIDTQEDEQNDEKFLNGKPDFEKDDGHITGQINLSSRNNYSIRNNNNNNSNMDSFRNYSNSSREGGSDLFTEDKLRKIYESFRKLKIKNMFKKDYKLNKIEGYEDFKGFFSVFLLVHKKCGRDCIHLKRFYEKIGFKEERRGSSRLEVKPKIKVIKHLPKI